MVTSSDKTCRLNKYIIALQTVSARDFLKMLWSVTQKVHPLCLVPPGPNISKYLDPWITYFKFAEIFGPQTKISELFGPS